MTTPEADCDVCEAETPLRKRRPSGQLNLCEECSAEFADSKIVGCC